MAMNFILFFNNNKIIGYNEHFSTHFLWDLTEIHKKDKKNYLSN